MNDSILIKKTEEEMLNALESKSYTAHSVLIVWVELENTNRLDSI